MQVTSVAQASEREEILEFLERQGRVQNAWLIWDVSDSIQSGADCCGTACTMS